MKKLFPLVFVLTILLSACAPAAAAEPTETVPSPTEEPAEVFPQEEEEEETVAYPASEDNPCTQFSLLDANLTEIKSDLPPVTEDDWSIGPDDAAVTFIEYSEPQCPFCASLEPQLMALYEMYPEDVRLVYRHFPLDSIHDKSLLASQALEAAGRQGKFQELKNFLFERQSPNPNNPAVADLPETDFWALIEPDRFDEWLAERVGELDIDPDQLVEDMMSEEIENIILDAKAEAVRLGLTGTPSLFFNGYFWVLQRSVDFFAVYTELVLNQAREYEQCPEMTIDTEKTYTAVITTTNGVIRAELFDDIAPYAVNSFIFLARDGFFDGNPILSDNDFFVSGDPTGTIAGGPGYVTLDESSDEVNLDEPGTLFIFNQFSTPGLNGSVFAINKTAQPDQEGNTIIGSVIEGLDVAQNAEFRPSFMLPEAEQIISVEIIEE